MTRDVTSEGCEGDTIAFTFLMMRGGLLERLSRGSAHWIGSQNGTSSSGLSWSVTRGRRRFFGTGIPSRRWLAMAQLSPTAVCKSAWLNTARIVVLAGRQLNL